MDKKKLIEIRKSYLNTYNQDNNNDKCEINKVESLIKKFTNKDGLYKHFPFESLAIEEQIKTLHHVLEEASERQIVANMSKEDINRDYNEFILTDKNIEKFTEIFLMEIKPDYKPFNIDYIISKNRDLIREKDTELKLVIYNTLKNNKRIIKYIFHEKDIFLGMGIGLEYMEYIVKYIEYLTDAFFQIINYRIITNENLHNKETIFSSILDMLDNLDKKIDFELEQCKNDNYKSQNLTSNSLTLYFSFYRADFSKYEEYTKVIQSLKEEVENDSKKELKEQLFNNVSDKYKVNKALVSDEVINNMETTITEDKYVYDFENKLLITKEFIDIMRNNGYRKCYSNSPQDVKVYFRELFLSKQTYRNKQASSIVKNYLNECKINGVKKFNDAAHYIFIREKISRGYFREKGLLDLYFMKLDMHKKLNHITSKIYLFYNYEDILKSIYSINKLIFEDLLELLYNLGGFYNEKEKM